MPAPYTTYTIRPEDQEFVGEVASKPSEQAKLKAMKYGSLLEFVAERFHAAQDFLSKINPGMDLEKLNVGDTVKVPNVQPFEVEKLSEKLTPKIRSSPTAKSSSTLGKFSRNPRGRQTGRGISHHSRIEVAARAEGRWKILGIATLPWFRHDEGVLDHGVRTNDFLNIPPGPNNPVGISGAA